MQAVEDHLAKLWESSMASWLEEAARPRFVALAEGLPGLPPAAPAPDANISSAASRVAVAHVGDVPAQDEDCPAKAAVAAAPPPATAAQRLSDGNAPAIVATAGAACSADASRRDLAPPPPLGFPQPLRASAGLGPSAAPRSEPGAAISPAPPAVPVPATAAPAAAAPPQPQLTLWPQQQSSFAPPSRTRPLHGDATVAVAAAVAMAEATASASVQAKARTGLALAVPPSSQEKAKASASVPPGAPAVSPLPALSSCSDQAAGLRCQCACRSTKKSWAAMLGEGRDGCSSRSQSNVSGGSTQPGVSEASAEDVSPPHSPRHARGMGAAPSGTGGAARSGPPEPPSRTVAQPVVFSLDAMDEPAEAAEACLAGREVVRDYEMIGAQIPAARQEVAGEAW